jgi:TusA-related sulfurtransferase
MPEHTDIKYDKEIDARSSFCPGPLMARDEQEVWTLYVYQA